MKPRHLGRLALVTLLTFAVGCFDGPTQPRRYPTNLQGPTPPPPSPPDNSVHFVRNGYSNSWEAVGLIGTTLTDHPFGVSVYAAGNQLSGVSILWKATGNGASITPTDDTTRVGRSEATLTLGPQEGAGYSVTATAPTLSGAPQLTFKATAVSQMVGVRDLADGGFVPASVTVTSGHWVGWRYESAEGDAHDVIFEDDPTQPVSSGDMWDLWAGVRYHTRVFDGPPRTIRYRCKYHSTGFVEGEVGTVTVR